jgi:hypothetical protein
MIYCLYTISYYDDSGSPAQLIVNIKFKQKVKLDHYLNIMWHTVNYGLMLKDFYLEQNSVNDT